MLVFRSCSCRSCFTSVCLAWPLSITKGSLPSSSDDPTKPTNINPLSKPSTRTTGLNGTRIIIATSGIESSLRPTSILLPKTQLETARK